MKTPLIKAVIFDMDGVLVNSEPHHVKIERKIFDEIGANIGLEEHAGYMGTASDEMWLNIIARHGLSNSPEELLEMGNQHVMSYFSSLKELKPMLGLVPVLDKLRELNIPMAVASSSSAEVVDLILDRSGLKQYFPMVVSGQMVEKSKPEPDIFLKVAAQLQLDSSACLVVEDSTNGIRAAKSAGMVCIAYRGEGFANQDQSLADEVIKDFTELMAFIVRN